MLKSRGPGLQNVTFFGDRVIADVISNEVTLEEGGPNRAGLVSLQETACDDRAPEAGKDPPQVAEGAQPCQNLVPDFHDSQTLSVLAGGTGCGSLRLWLSALGPCRQRHQVWLDVPKLRQASLETAGVQQVLQFPPAPPNPNLVFPAGSPAPDIRGTLQVDLLGRRPGQTQAWPHIGSASRAFGEVSAPGGRGVGRQRGRL